MEKRKNGEAVVILIDIRSAHNVGSIFRTADAARIAKIYLAGITPIPVDRFGRERKDIAKAALGAEKTVPWEYLPAIRALLTRLKKEGYRIIAVEQSPDSVDYKKVKIKKGERAAIIFGNEVSGVPEQILERCDVVAEIPMQGMKESLNVSVAAGIAFFRMLGL